MSRHFLRASGGFARARKCKNSKKLFKIQVPLFEFRCLYGEGHILRHDEILTN